jgi:hypothetical protein
MRGSTAREWRWLEKSKEGGLFLFGGTNVDRDGSAFHPDVPFEGANVLQVYYKLSGEIKCKIGVLGFTAFQTDGAFDLVTFFQKLSGALHFGIVVVIINADAHFNFFDVDHMLFFLGFARFLIRFELKFTVVDQAHDQRRGIKAHDYQIQPTLTRHGFGIPTGNNLVDFAVNQTDFSGSNVRGQYLRTFVNLTLRWILGNKKALQFGCIET